MQLKGKELRNIHNKNPRYLDLEARKRLLLPRVLLLSQNQLDEPQSQFVCQTFPGSLGWKGRLKEP